jgi:hypothetical protein
MAREESPCQLTYPNNPPRDRNPLLALYSYNYYMNMRSHVRGLKKKKIRGRGNGVFNACGNIYVSKARQLVN